MGVSKVVIGSTVKLDLTGDTVTAADLLEGVTAHDKAGNEVVGECTYDSNTQDDTAAVAEVLSGQTFHARAQALQGTMPNIGKQTGTISNKTDSITISKGYHDGSGTVQLSSTAKAQLVATNIKSGTIVMGVTGTYEGESTEVRQTNKTVSPSLSQQVITPDDGYTCLSQVTVSAVSVTETANAAGGTTLKIL